MSAHRRVKIPHPPAPGSCRWCGEAVLRPDGTPGRATWHPACVDEYRIQSWPEATRTAAWQQDRGVCQGCGRDLLAEMLRLVGQRVTDELARTAGVSRIYRFRTWADQARLHGAVRYTLAREDHRRLVAWQADHRVPLIDGGSKGRDNLQVLCDSCHKQKTAREARARADARRGQMVLG